jgi:myotubularin-related protein 6/7/8
VVGLGGSHVLIHCSDGWDRTSQVSALAQIMLDPYYRTLDGFITLVQKDFISFGHKFRDRNGIEGCEKWFEIENERIQPARSWEDRGAEPNAAAKALSGAKSWFEKNRGNLFKQQNPSRDSLSENPNSRPASPPPNPIIHSTPAKTEDKQHKMDPKEVSPIFHQFLDAVYQLQYQRPNAFEFNERFLRRLYYQVYAGQYGEFIFNNDRERSEHKDKLPSAWGYFLARRAEFTNPDFSAKTDDPLLFPRRQGADREIEVRWWNMLFGRKDEEMNVPRALEQPVLENRSASVGAAEVLAAGLNFASPKTADARVVEPRGSSDKSNTPEKNSTSNDDIPVIAGTAQQQQRPTLSSQETDTDVLARYAGVSSTSAVVVKPEGEASTTTTTTTAADTQPAGGDPLGVSTDEPLPHRQQSQQTTRAGGVDFAAFARENAFRDS